MSLAKLNVGVVFGGVSPEHEVSVISSLQAFFALDRDRYEPVPVYISKEGLWYTGDCLVDVEAYQDLEELRKKAMRVSIDTASFGTLTLVEADIHHFSPRKPRRVNLDVLLLGLHGGAGEDGSVQGVCETFNIPYTGSSVFGSAMGMDKVLSKMLCRDQDIPVVDFVAFREREWADREEVWLDRCEESLGYPVVVKPARLGSSIGITRAVNRDELDHAIEEALRYDDKIVVEQAIQQLKEINCAVLGDPGEAIASVLEQPIRTEGESLLTYEEKYMRGGGGSKGAKRREGTKKDEASAGGMASLDRIIPAPLPDEQTDYMRALAVRVFQLFECGGVARIDFMIDDETGKVYFNEINTIPGSFSFYLWEPSDVPFQELLHRMIELARRRHRERNGRIRTYDVNLLSEHSLRGLKGSKT